MFSALSATLQIHIRASVYNNPSFEDFHTFFFAKVVD